MSRPRPFTAKTGATTRIWVSCPKIFTSSSNPGPRIGRPPKHDVAEWTVTDDWPRRVPVTEAEVDVFEAWGVVKVTAARPRTSRHTVS
jgi:hypothetical protein